VGEIAVVEEQASPLVGGKVAVLVKILEEKK
jgi:hypothetical protein